MKKILLVSMMHNVTDLLKEAEPDLKGKKVVYIPTAAIAEEIEGMAEEETRMLEDMGLIVDELEVSTASRKTVMEKLTKNDMIFVGGGNTFFLLQELKRSGADQIISQEVEKGKLYIGESAGAIAACPDIRYSAEMDVPEKAPELTGYTGMGLVDFYVVPHLGHPEMGPAAERIIEQYSSVPDLKVINDYQAILVKGDKVRILPESCVAEGSAVEIRKVETDKKEYMPLLLLADEQEDMIDRYLDRGTLYVLDDGGVKCECVVTDEGGGVLEIKNIATAPEWRGHGYGKAMLDFVAAAYRGRYSILQVGTGDSPLTIPFYEKCGFTRSHRIRNFFTDHYDHPIYEAGVRLVDMIYLQKKIGNEETSKQPAGRTGQKEENQ